MPELTIGDMYKQKNLILGFFVRRFVAFFGRMFGIDFNAKLDIRIEDSEEADLLDSYEFDNELSLLQVADSFESIARDHVGSACKMLM